MSLQRSRFSATLRSEVTGKGRRGASSEVSLSFNSYAMSSRIDMYLEGEKVVNRYVSGEGGQLLISHEENIYENKRIDQRGEKENQSFDLK